MNRIWAFRNFTFYNDKSPETVTIAGEDYRRLLDLCFAQADRFSLIRRDYLGVSAGTLERELRPFLLGTYRSYSCLHMFGEEHWADCCLYRATDEAKEIILRHFGHLFDREGMDSSWQLPEKYRACEEAMEAAGERFDAYFDSAGDDLTMEALVAFEKENSREAKRLWEEAFDPADFSSQMEDLCFFRGDGMFFETITHEGICRAEILSEAFGAELRALGEWIEEERAHAPLFSLKGAKELRYLP